MDDVEHVGSHLTYSGGKIPGWKFDTKATVTSRIENKEKTYRFKAGPLDFEIKLVLDKTDDGTNLTIIVDYEMPYSWFGKLIDFLFVRRYVEKEVDKTYETCQKILEENPPVRN